LERQNQEGGKDNVTATGVGGVTRESVAGKVRDNGKNSNHLGRVNRLPGAYNSPTWNARWRGTVVGRGVVRRGRMGGGARGKAYTLGASTGLSRRGCEETGSRNKAKGGWGERFGSIGQRRGRKKVLRKCVFRPPPSSADSLRRGGRPEG